MTLDQSPSATFTSENGFVGMPLTFDAGASTVQFGSIMSYNWTFGGWEFDAVTWPDHADPLVCRDIPCDAMRDRFQPE